MKLWGDPSGPVLAVAGLALEARLAGGPGIRALAGGGDTAALAAAIEREVARGARALISFGIAGALAPSLVRGALVVASGVCAAGASPSLATDARWSAALLRLIPDAVSGELYGSEIILADARHKAKLHARSGAIAVDMESHVAGRIAAAHGLPFAVLRAIADPADRSLPPAALVGMRSQGGVDLAAVLRSIAGSPSQLGALLRIALDARAALSALARGHRLAGDRLGCSDLDELPLHVV